MYPYSMATEIYNKAMDIAVQTAAEVVFTDFIGSEHLIYAFLSVPESEAYKVLTGAGVSLDDYKQQFVPATKNTKGGEGLTPNTTKMYNKAIEAAQAEGLLASTAHVLYQILSVPSCMAVRLLRRLAGEDLADQKELIEELIHFLNRSILKSKFLT